MERTSQWREIPNGERSPVKIQGSSQWRRVLGVVQPGHRVASGAGESPYPQGTIALQKPYFKDLGLDLANCYDATLNISTQPYHAVMRHPSITFAALEWTPLHPPETFSFSRCGLEVAGNRYLGWVYYPHPETKQRHFQEATVLEILAPWIPTVCYGMAIALYLNPHEVEIERLSQQRQI